MAVAHSFQEITLKHEVPFVIWCYWEGEAMNKNRATSFAYLTANIEVPVLLVTRQNLSQFILAEHPLHPSFEDLSIVHRSDYIRAYLLHHYGGGWHDIKATEVSFKDCWADFSDKNIWMLGRPETQKGAAQIYNTAGEFIPDYYDDLISVPTWIGRPYTAFSEELYQGIRAMLDQHQDKLKKYPAKHPREKYIQPKNFIHQLIIRIKHAYSGRNPYYPLPWTVFGNVFHPLCLKYKAHIAKTIPLDSNKNAGIYHR